jgi:hypothetical protein
VQARRQRPVLRAPERRLVVRPAQAPLREQRALHSELLQEPVLQVMYRTAGQKRRL